MRKGRLAALVAFAAAIALAAYGFVIEPGRLVVREVEVAPAGWPAAGDGMRVALLGDLHVGSPRNGVAHLRQAIAAVRAHRPDAVFLLGDYVIQGVVGGRFVPPERTAAELRALLGPPGAQPLAVYAVLGNHDGWLDTARVARALRSAGITLLANDAARLARPGRPAVWVLGVQDLWTGHPDVQRALSSVTDSAPAVLLTHSPDIFPFVPARVSLTVAAHTHGGQVALPLVGRPVVPSRFGRRYAEGHVVEGGRHLYVTAGLGTSILPVRFRVPPEVVILTLRAGVR